ncbi:antibiotic biosynthesis monooxygenase family protein [Actinoallomurus sp. NPDC052274]|uniref:antibiotic biosynthesis monooxygenase family protein n=1 Tax=Actinoallomurus sp. NPDC052274 TaxID=3155420 RepID=UPI00341A7FCC
MSDDPVRVVVHYRNPASPERAVQTAYQAARDMLRGTPGLVRHELLRSTAGDDVFALLMEWEDTAAYEAWEREMRRQGHPSPLRPYQDRSRPGGHYEVYTVTER